jgi:hypothetical protein
MKVFKCHEGIDRRRAAVPLLLFDDGPDAHGIRRIERKGDT